MRRIVALAALAALAGCAQPQFQTAGIDPGVAARCKLLAVTQPDRTMYTNSIMGSLILSSTVNSVKERQVYDACVEAAAYRGP